MTELEGKVAIVTGASRGIGAATARMLADEGVRLGLVSRSGDDLGIADAVAQPTDVRDRAQLAALVDETVRRHGGLDIVVANAGVGAYGPFVELDPAHIDEMMDVNATGVISTAAATVPHLIARGGGDFVSVASEAGRRGLRSRRSTALPSSRKSALRARSTTSCALREFGALASVPVGLRPISRWRRDVDGRRRCPSWPG